MRHPVVMPDLGLENVSLSLWLVDEGAPVTEGDRIVEVQADGVTVDLPAPVSGVLIETRVDEDEPIVPGQALGTIETSETAE
ncbi:MAG TPA: lipoyl domain-containing protein [Pirellulales bacterium]|nr:lipoyl domain-containing protein [Pirellulales bacterium]